MRALKPPIPARECRAASTAWLYVKTLAQTAVFWGFFLFLAPAALLWAEERIAGDAWRWRSDAGRVAGAAFFAAMGALGLWSGWVMTHRGRGTPLPFDCPTRLVVQGPYRHVRNPMAVAGIGQGVGVGVWTGSWIVVAYALCGALVWDLLVRRWEEHDLQARFGPAYDEYRAHVRCWRPRLRGWRPGRDG